MLFCLPYIDNSNAIVDEKVRIHLLCSCLVCKELWHLAEKGMDQSGMLQSSHL
jgi:hypothetical protein